MNLAGVIGGALPPLIAGTLRATYGSWAIGLMLATLALASLVCTYLLPETNGTALRTTQGVHVGHGRSSSAAAVAQLACRSSLSAMP